MAQSTSQAPERALSSVDTPTVEQGNFKSQLDSFVSPLNAVLSEHLPDAHNNLPPGYCSLASGFKSPVETCIDPSRHNGNPDAASGPLLVLQQTESVDVTLCVGGNRMPIEDDQRLHPTDIQRTKSRSKFAKGWEKFCQSFRHNIVAASDQKVKRASYPHSSSTARSRHGRSLVLPLIKDRKAVSDMGPPVEPNQEEEGPIGRCNMLRPEISANLRSRSLNELPLRDSCLSLSEYESDDGLSSGQVTLNDLESAAASLCTAYQYSAENSIQPCTELSPPSTLESPAIIDGSTLDSSGGWVQDNSIQQSGCEHGDAFCPAISPARDIQPIEQQHEQQHEGQQHLKEGIPTDGVEQTQLTMVSSPADAGLHLEEEYEPEVHSDLEYQSDSALFAPPSQLRLVRKRDQTRPKSYAHHRTLKLQWGSKTRLDKTGTEQQENSATELESNVDHLAVAAMREHMIQSMRSRKRLPRPSVATIHSITAEADFIIRNTTTTPTPTGESAHTSSISPLKTQDDTAVGSETMSARDVPQDNELGDIDGEDNTTLDPNYQKRETLLVEREILRSEKTTMFLTASLEGLFPSSAQTLVPPAILPSARKLLILTSQITSAKNDLCCPGSLLSTSPATTTAVQHSLPLSLEGSSTTTTAAQAHPLGNCDLTLPLQEPIQLPPNHSASEEDCSCSFCRTHLKPSQIPVLTQAQYELAELQSQCDGKDQHILELLKTVRDLQCEINVLNAKLLFLHDHHTTRPMRRRKLERHRYPINSVLRFGEEQEEQRSTFPQQAPPWPHSSYTQGRCYLNGQSSRRFTTFKVDDSLDLSSSPSHAFPDGIHLSDHEESLRDRDKRICFSRAMAEDMSNMDQNNHRADYPTSPVANVMDGSGGGFESDLEEEPEQEGVDVLDEYYYLDAYKTMDQQLYRRPVLPTFPPPRSLSSTMYRSIRHSAPIYHGHHPFGR